MNKKAVVPLFLGIGALGWIVIGSALLLLPFILIGGVGSFKFLSWMLNPGQLPMWGIAIILIFLFLLITKRKE